MLAEKFVTELNFIEPQTSYKRYCFQNMRRHMTFENSLNHYKVDMKTTAVNNKYNEISQKCII